MAGAGALGMVDAGAVPRGLAFVPGMPDILVPPARFRSRVCVVWRYAFIIVLSACRLKVVIVFRSPRVGRRETRLRLNGASPLLLFILLERVASKPTSMVIGSIGFLFLSDTKDWSPGCAGNTLGTAGARDGPFAMSFSLHG